MIHPLEALRRLFVRRWPVIIPPYADGHVNGRCYTMPAERTLPEDWLDHVITMPYYCLPHVDLHPNIVGHDVWLEGRRWRIVGANFRTMDFELYPLDDPAAE